MRLPSPELSFRRWLTQTFLGRLLLLSSVVVTLLLGSAAVGYFIVGNATNYGQAVWQGLLHFIAPGTLATDKTVPARLLGLFQVMVGLVFYVGVLIVIITEGVSRSLERLRSYEAPLHISDHVLFVGAHGDLPFIFRALQADLFDRPTTTADVPRAIVAMVPDSVRADRFDLAENLQAEIPSIPVRVVVADSRNIRSYRLASAQTASQIIICANSGATGAATLSDFETSATLLLVTEYLDGFGQRKRPRILVDTTRGRHADAFARTAWARAGKPIVRDRGLGARLRFGVMHPEFTPFLGSGRQGAWRQTDVIEPGNLVGTRFEDLAAKFTDALPIGILQDDGTHVRAMAPPAYGYQIRSTDQLALLRSHTSINGGPPRRRPRPTGARLLIVGWAAPTRELLRALAARQDAIERITIVSRTDWRSEMGTDSLPPNMVTVAGDFALPAILDTAFAEADPDTIIVTSKFDSDSAADDARTAFAVMRLRQLSVRSAVPIFALFSRPISPAMFDNDPRIMVSSAVEVEASSLALAVSRYPVSVLMRDLLGGRDVESVRVAPVESLVAEPTRFADIYALLLSVGEVPLCAYTANGRLLYPPEADQMLGEGASLLVARVDDQSVSTSTLELGLHTGL